MSCQGKTKLGVAGPSNGPLDRVPEGPGSEDDSGDDDDEADGRSNRNTVELTQGQQDSLGSPNFTQPIT